MVPENQKKCVCGPCSSGRVGRPMKYYHIYCSKVTDNILLAACPHVLMISTLNPSIMAAFNFENGLSFLLFHENLKGFSPFEFPESHFSLSLPEY